MKLLFKPDLNTKRVTAPLILSTVAMASPSANISARSSSGLPSFRLSFFRSALRRFLDDLLRTQGRPASRPVRRRFGPEGVFGLVVVGGTYEEMRELLWEYLEPLAALLASE